MKIERTEKKHFQPVTLEITLESFQDVVEMWAYLNIPYTAVLEGNKSCPEILQHLGKVDNHKCAYNLFCVIDDILSEVREEHE